LALRHRRDAGWLRRWPLPTLRFGRLPGTDLDQPRLQRNGPGRPWLRSRCIDRDKMLMQSWPAYEAIPAARHADPDRHYRLALRPNIESSERNGWGQWHDADRKA